MIITSTTLITLLKGVASPVVSVKQAAEEAYSKQKNEQKFNVDIPVDDGPAERKKQREQMTPKQKRLIDAYQGKETAPEPQEEPAPDAVPEEEVTE